MNAAVLADSPRLYLPLAETSGVMVDQSGNGNDGTVSGGVTRGVAAYYGNGATFDGVDDKVQVAAHSAFNAMGINFSIECAVKFSTSQFTPAWAKRSSDGTRVVGLYSGSYLTSSKQMTFWLYETVPTTRRRTWTTVSEIGDGVWHHVCATWDGSVPLLYVDGVSVAFTETFSSGTLPSGDSTSEDMFVGNNNGTLWWNGGVDECALYNTTLTPARVAAHAATIPAAVTNLAGTAGNTQVPLTWTAPADGGAAITDYVVQYRPV